MKKAGGISTGIWNRAFVRVFLYAVLCQFTMAVTNTVLPLYVINGLGRSATESGLLGTLFTVGSLLCRFVSGYLCDRFGRRACMIAGALIVGLCLIALGFETTMLLLLLTKTLQGVGHAIDSTASNAAAAEVLPPDRVGQGLGYYALHSMLTNAVGPTLCLALMGVGAAAGGQNFRLPLLVGGGMGLAAAVLGAATDYEKRMPPRAGSARRDGIRLSDFLERRALLPAVMIFFTAFSTGAGTYMIVFADGMGFSSIRVYYIIDALASAAVRFGLGKRLDAVRPRAIAALAIPLNIVAYTLLGLTGSEWAFLLSAVLLGVFNAMLMPMFNAMAMKLAPPGRSGSASSTYWLGFDVGMALGMLFFGAVIDRGGFRTVFFLCAGFMLLFGAVAIPALRRFPPVRDIRPAGGDSY